MVFPICMVSYLSAYRVNHIKRRRGRGRHTICAILNSRGIGLSVYSGGFSSGSCSSGGFSSGSCSPGGFSSGGFLLLRFQIRKSCFGPLRIHFFIRIKYLMAYLLVGERLYEISLDPQFQNIDNRVALRDGTGDYDRGRPSFLASRISLSSE